MGWQRFLRRARWDRERIEEIESYVRSETDDNIAGGMSYDQARAAARRKLGISSASGARPRVFWLVPERRLW